MFLWSESNLPNLVCGFSTEKRLHSCDALQHVADLERPGALSVSFAGLRTEAWRV